MIRWIAAVMLIAVAAPAAAQSFERVPGAELDRTLRDKTIVYADGFQVFYGNGRTLYNTGPEQWGFWRVERGRLCVTWPPEDDPVCGGVEIAGRQVRMPAPNGDILQGTFTN